MTASFLYVALFYIAVRQNCFVKAVIAVIVHMQCGFFKRRRSADEPAEYRASIQKRDPLMYDYRD